MPIFLSLPLKKLCETKCILLILTLILWDVYCISAGFPTFFLPAFCYFCKNVVSVQDTLERLPQHGLNSQSLEPRE